MPEVQALAAPGTTTVKVIGDAVLTVKKDFLDASQPGPGSLAAGGGVAVGDMKLVDMREVLQKDLQKKSDAEIAEKMQREEYAQAAIGEAKSKIPIPLRLT